MDPHPCKQRLALPLLSIKVLSAPADSNVFSRLNKIVTPSVPKWLSQPLEFSILKCWLEIKYFGHITVGVGQSFWDGGSSTRVKYCSSLNAKLELVLEANTLSLVPRVRVSISCTYRRNYFQSFMLDG